MFDVLDDVVDAAAVSSNDDSDLAFPAEQARLRVPVGMINPTKNSPSGRLRGAPQAGAGRTGDAT
ncbi:hypothetical protein [Rhodococcus aetherivorans]|uniref:hypothetical protein n=1 Tax=Rhodococcus aetherivorans TaxID=191292 RepID=UPI00163B3935|nr:hypothetical protein [Rhodococcus aetherivorans]MBC2592377.1 hypothetical protein [Rhodococcus aetherivorans]